jgi:hypothetical protein
MAASPAFKVYRDGEYIASCKHPEDAAMIIAGTGSGQVKHRHGKLLWDEGQEEIAAGESYDRAAKIMLDRL